MRLTANPPGETDIWRQKLDTPAQAVAAGTSTAETGPTVVVDFMELKYAYHSMDEDEEWEAFRALSVARLTAEIDEEPDFDPDL